MRRPFRNIRHASPRQAAPPPSLERDPRSADSKQARKYRSRIGKPECSVRFPCRDSDRCEKSGARPALRTAPGLVQLPKPNRGQTAFRSPRDDGEKLRARGKIEKRVALRSLIFIYLRKQIL